MPIRETLTADHRSCDDLFANAEQAAGDGDLVAAQAAFNAFQAAMLAHFASEEQILFPAFEMQTGMHQGPTQMMRFEHEQMRGLMDAATAALGAGQPEDFLEQAETLLIMMQQHNMKEENVLYPMCDQHLAAQADAVSQRLHEALVR